MNIALCSDEVYAVNDTVRQFLEAQGHTVQAFGSMDSQQTEAWADVTRSAAEAVAAGRCEEGVFFCWSGTGAAIVANKIPGIRAALCTDAETAKAARLWNNANVLVLSNRLTSPDLAKEILEAWLNSVYDGRAANALKTIAATEQRYFDK